MKEKNTCSVCKGTGVELFKHIDPKTGEEVTEKIKCEVCCGRGSIVFSIDNRITTFYDNTAEKYDELL